jgi:hypothetical protein
MAEETIYCPSCNNKVRVPEEMLGQPVQCPLCGVIFVAPVRGPAAADAPPPTVLPVPSAPTMYPGPPHPVPTHLEADARYDAILNLVRAPATALLLLGLLGWLSHAAEAFYTRSLGPEGLAEQMERTQEQFAFLAGPDREAAAKMFTKESLYQFKLGFHLLMLLLCTVVMIGAGQMLRLRQHWMAVLGSVLVMLNISNCCCVIGIPVGLWSLSVLLRPDVRSTFE